MATIIEDYVSFETAKLLKEKGFDEYCPESYFKMDKTLKKSGFSEWEKVNEVKAPTQSLAMKWLREVHNIDISIIPLRSHKEYLPRVESDITSYDAIPYRKYETACETAIKYCLENLI